MYMELMLPDDGGHVSYQHVLKNIDIIKNEISMMERQASHYCTVPVYKTIREFALQEFLLVFGLKETDVFRLTKLTHYASLPQLVVLHCSDNAKYNDTMPQIIGEKLYMCQHYFLDRISDISDTRLQTELLHILLDVLSVENSYEN